jgi:hypothetical protein
MRFNTVEIPFGSKLSQPSTEQSARRWKVEIARPDLGRYTICLFSAFGLLEAPDLGQCFALASIKWGSGGFISGHLGPDRLLAEISPTIHRITI